MKRRHLPAMILIFLLVLIASETKAEQFTFQVPVTLTNLHKDITKGKVSCTVVDSQNKVLPSTSISGSSDTVFDIVNGNYTGTVTVKQDVANPWLAVTYSCSLFLKSKYEASFWRPSMLTGDKAVVSKKEMVSGTVPRQ